MKKFFAIITAVFYAIFACNSIAAKYSDEATLKKVKQVSLGGSHSAAITEDGCLYLWGFDGTGQIGDKWVPNVTNEEHYYPKKILENVASVSLGWSHSAAITNDGSLYTWGNNRSGQLGDGSTKNYDYPIKIMDNVTAVSLGYEHSAAITTDGSLYMWGNNSSGALGVGRLWEKESMLTPLGGYDGFDETMCSTVPMKVMDNVKSVSLGDSRSAAITNDGSLYVW